MVDDEPTLDLSRREFMQVGAVPLAALATSDGIQLQTETAATEYEFQGAAHLLGPEDARPAPDSQFFDNKKFYAYIYEVSAPASMAGTRYFKTQADSEWSVLHESMPRTQVDEVKTESFTSFFNHHFARPEAPDTKNWDFTDADVTKQNSEIELASSTVMESTQRGNYPPGSEAVPGCAARLTAAPSGGEALFGYYDGTDGFGVGEDGTDSFVFVRKRGEEHRVYRSDWNGHDPGERVWANRYPVITRFPHLFYGGGGIQFKAVLHGSGEPRLRTLHVATPDVILDDYTNEGPPFDQPNLPVRFETSSLSGAALRANACHYNYGDSHAENRQNGEHFSGISAGSTGWTPVISWQKRDGWDSVNVAPVKLDIVARTNDARLGLQLGATVSSTSFGLPTNSDSSETAVHVATDGTLDVVGNRRWTGYVASGNPQSLSMEQSSLEFNLPAGTIITLVAQGVGGTSDLSGAIGWEEFF